MSDNKKDQLSIHDSHHNLESGNQHGPKRPDSMRRRSLIKASVAAVPTVLTLRSGLVSATSMDCRQKDAAVPDRLVPSITDPDQDGWLRAKAEVFEGDGLAAFVGHHVDVAKLKLLVEDYNDDTLIEGSPSYGKPSFCSLPPEEQIAKLTEWSNSFTKTIQRYEGTFLHVIATKMWYVSNLMQNYIKIKNLDKDFILCNQPDSPSAEKEVLCYVTFDEVTGHILVDDIRTYPDDGEGAQKITESCACSIDPMFQLGDV